jgi:hypothetical protein
MVLEGKRAEGVRRKRKGKRIEVLAAVDPKLNEMLAVGSFD